MSKIYGGFSPPCNTCFLWPQLNFGPWRFKQKTHKERRIGRREKLEALKLTKAEDRLQRNFLWDKKKLHDYTLFEIFIFCPKNSTLISRENCQFLGVKNSWKCCGFGLFSCWQLWFHEKNLGEKLVKMLGFCQNWIFGQKFDFSNSVGI